MNYADIIRAPKIVRNRFCNCDGELLVLCKVNEMLWIIHGRKMGAEQCGILCNLKSVPVILAQTDLYIRVAHATGRTRTLDVCRRRDSGHRRKDCY